MPREDRRVIFSLGEVYNALYKLIEKNPDAPPLRPGAIAKIEPDGLDANKINVFIVNSQTGEKVMISYSRDFVAAALMMMCRGCGIPLPKKGTKTVMLDVERVILRVMI